MTSFVLKKTKHKQKLKSNKVIEINTNIFNKKTLDKSSAFWAWLGELTYSGQNLRKKDIPIDLRPKEFRTRW